MTPKTALIAVAALIVAIIPLAVFAVVPFSTLVPTLVALAAGGVAMATNLVDKELEKSIALPNGAVSVNSAGLDLQNGTHGDFVARPVEIEIDAPALTTGQLPDTQTITYHVEHDTDAAFGTATTVLSSVIVQTGAGGVGDGAETVRHKLPSDVKRHVRLKATKTGAADASAKSATVRLRF